MVNICVIEVLEEHMAQRAFGEIMIKGDTKINSVVKPQTQDVPPTQLEKNKATNKGKLSTRRVRAKCERQRLGASLEGREKTHYTDRSKDEKSHEFYCCNKVISLIT